MAGQALQYSILGKYRRFFAGICDFPLNICDPFTYMRSCFTNICDPVSQIYVMSHIYMRSYFTNICDRCQRTFGAPGPSTREAGPEDKGPPCWFSNGSSQISTSQRLPQSEF